LIVEPIMDDQTFGINYILASSVENKDSEVTLKNEAPKSEYSIKSIDSRENTLRNEIPLSERSLRKDQPIPIVPHKKEDKPIEIPSSTEKETEEYKESRSHKTIDGSGKITWDKTHFIFGVESGSIIGYKSRRTKITLESNY
jgi:hypothetical protein